jgi:hypothetical protein
MGTDPTDTMKVAANCQVRVPNSMEWLVGAGLFCFLYRFRPSAGRLSIPTHKANPKDARERVMSYDLTWLQGASR